MRDWIDEEKARRDHGVHHPLLPSEHAEVNGRYPGTTLEYCTQCDAATGRAGRADDSLYATNNTGPFCRGCFDELPEELRP